MRTRKDWDLWEDDLLLKLVSEHGEKWRTISRAFKNVGGQRTDDALRHRWTRLITSDALNVLDVDNRDEILYTTKEIQDFINTL